MREEKQLYCKYNRNYPEILRLLFRVRSASLFSNGLLWFPEISSWLLTLSLEPLTFKDFCTLELFSVFCLFDGRGFFPAFLDNWFFLVRFFLLRCTTNDSFALEELLSTEPEKIQWQFKIRMSLQMIWFIEISMSLYLHRNIHTNFIS